MSWHKRHIAIMHAECEPIEDNNQKRPQIPPCHELGFCLCGPEGKLVAKMRAAFLRHMKQIFRPKTEYRELLVNKAAIVRLHGQRQQSDDPWARADAEIEGSVAGDFDEVLHWHIGAHSFSPYGSTFRSMRFVAEEAVGGRLELRLEAPLCGVLISAPRGMCRKRALRTSFVSASLRNHTNARTSVSK